MLLLQICRKYRFLTRKAAAINGNFRIKIHITLLPAKLFRTFAESSFKQKSMMEFIKADSWGLFEGMPHPWVIAGPCSAESESQVYETAAALKAAGIGIFRAGLWKPRTHPDCFEGVGERGLPWLARVRRELGMRVATEVANARHVEKALEAGIDLLWIGARTTSNPFAIQEIADALRGCATPVLVKNPLTPDLELWTGALERLSLAGVRRLGAVHRGFFAYGQSRYRNLPQWQLPVEIRRRFPDLPVLCDPSHIAGRREYVQELAQQAMDLGFDGLMVESHISPEHALSDAAQQLTPAALQDMLQTLVIRSADTENRHYRESMDELRLRIDAIDDELIDLLASRLEIADRIGEYKRQNNITILQTGRWEKVLERVFARGAERGLDAGFLARLFALIHQASIDRQTQVMHKGK